jgi:hypothetical protein
MNCLQGWVFLKTIVVLLAIVTSIQYDSSAQVIDSKLSLQDRTQQSTDLVIDSPYFVEGVLIDSRSTYGTDGKTIYTVASVCLIADYKKNVNADTIFLVRKGGTIGLDHQISMHNYGPSLGLHHKYFLLLKQNEHSVDLRQWSNSPTAFFNLIDEYSKASYAMYSRSRDDDFYVKGFYNVQFNDKSELEIFFQKSHIEVSADPQTCKCERQKATRQSN